MITRQKALKNTQRVKKSDQDIMKDFLKKNPDIQMLSKPSVSIKALTPSSIARKKFQLKNPQINISLPRVKAVKLASAKEGLSNLMSHVDREKKLINSKILHSIYYDPSHPAGYGAAYLLYQYAVKKLPTLKYREVEEWLKKQRAHYLSKRVRKFERRPVLVRGVRHQFQADLMDFKPIADHNYRRRYLLTVIDCFSRKAAAIPLRSKKGPPVKRGLEKAFEKLGYPKKLQTDQGKEFLNSSVRRFLLQNNVAHFFTNQELKAQMVERFNRTLRDKIAKHIFAKDSYTFMGEIEDMVDAYNNKIHSTLKKYSPNQVNKSNEDEVRQILYKDYFSKKKDLHKYNIGDKVRPFIKRANFKKMTHTFKEDIHTITDVLDTFPPTYHIKDSNNTAVKGAFYEKQLQPV